MARVRPKQVLRKDELAVAVGATTHREHEHFGTLRDLGGHLGWDALHLDRNTPGRLECHDVVINGLGLGRRLADRSRSTVPRVVHWEVPNVPAARKVLFSEPRKLVRHKPRAVDDVGPGGSNLVGNAERLLLALVRSGVDSRSDQCVGSAPPHVGDHVLARLEVASPRHDHVDSSGLGSSGSPLVECSGEHDLAAALESHQVGHGELFAPRLPWHHSGDR
mmetsp:Transcript_18249/g.54084  ORF Transcript_18249/g.54084 Transcript_18249/m.54084 type:complete len:220 (-) Transcript_18249:294-953(-)